MYYLITQNILRLEIYCDTAVSAIKFRSPLFREEFGTNLTKPKIKQNKRNIGTQRADIK